MDKQSAVIATQTAALEKLHAKIAANDKAADQKAASKEEETKSEPTIKQEQTPSHPSPNEDQARKQLREMETRRIQQKINEAHDLSRRQGRSGQGSRSRSPRRNSRRSFSRDRDRPDHRENRPRPNREPRDPYNDRRPNRHYSKPPPPNRRLDPNHQGCRLPEPSQYAQQTSYSLTYLQQLSKTARKPVRDKIIEVLLCTDLSYPNHSHFRSLGAFLGSRVLDGPGLRNPLSTKTDKKDTTACCIGMASNVYRTLCVAHNKLYYDPTASDTDPCLAILPINTAMCLVGHLLKWVNDIPTLPYFKHLTTKQELEDVVERAKAYVNDFIDKLETIPLISAEDWSDCKHTTPTMAIQTKYKKEVADLLATHKSYSSSQYKEGLAATAEKHATTYADSLSDMLTDLGDTKLVPARTLARPPTTTSANVTNFIPYSPPAPPPTPQDNPRQRSPDSRERFRSRRASSSRDRSRGRERQRSRGRERQRSRDRRKRNRSNSSTTRQADTSPRTPTKRRDTSIPKKVQEHHKPPRKPPRTTQPTSKPTHQNNNKKQQNNKRTTNNKQTPTTTTTTNHSHSRSTLHRSRRRP
jgi:hypothetical protein